MFTVRESNVFLQRESNEKIEELRDLSEMARRVFIHRRCKQIRRDVETMLRNKSTFLADLVKSLTKVTGEWRAWNHEIFGGVRTKVYVASIAQVDELLKWTNETYAIQATIMKQLTSSASYRKFTNDTLQMFLEMCKKMRDTEENLNRIVVQPLKTFFNDPAATKYLHELDSLQKNWKGLLMPGAINADFFSKGSMQFMRNVEGLDNFHNFYFVLRLIPDLCYKCYECLELVRMCLDTDDSKAYRREAHFLIRIWLPKQREEIETCKRKVLKETLTKDIDDHCSKKEQLQAKAADLTEKLDDATKELDRIKQQEKSLESLLKSHIKERDQYVSDVHSLQTDQSQLEEEIDDIRAAVKIGKQSLRKGIWSHYSRSDADEHQAYSELKTDVVESIKQHEKRQESYQQVRAKINQHSMEAEKMENLIFRREFELKRIREERKKVECMIDGLLLEEESQRTECNAIGLQVSVMQRKLQSLLLLD